MYLKHWEIIADNLSKAGWSWGCVSAVDSSERTIFAVDAHRDGKRSVNGREKKSSTNSPSRATAASKDKRNLLPFQFHSRSLIGKRWDGKKLARPYASWKKARPETRPGFLGEIAPIESTPCSIYFPIGAGAGVTTSLCCAQAPSPKAVTRTATIMIIFRNFNLSRLLSSQVAPVRLGGEPRRSNAFLQLFWAVTNWPAGLFCV